MICIECKDVGEEQDEAVEADPRTPPLEVGICLCLGHFIGAANDRIDELDREMTDLEGDMERAQKALKKKGRPS